ncbi:MAG TPA: porin [Terriglobales bacterium]|nr:porin [Terriglobales bacterium]
MRSLTMRLLLVLFFVALVSLALVQGQETANQSGGSAVPGATREEVEQLRKEVAAQQQTIEELKAMVQQLADSQTQAASANRNLDPGAGGAHLVNATYVQPEVLIETAEPAQAATAAPKKDAGAPVTAGWNGDHFYIKSSDGQFQIMPYGYVQNDYRGYKGDGAPSNTFTVRRARFGFQGNYGKHYDFALLIDAAASNGISLRDLYLNVKPVKEFQVQVGQFKEPFAQETLTAVTNIDFIERSLASLLYPAAATAYRSPGVTIHGDLSDGVVQYWVGAFNGKGILAADTTNEPEIIGRLRFYPWRKKKDNILQGFAFGGSIGRGRTRGLSNEQSINGTLPDAAYNFFPSFPLNGKVERYNGEFTWTHSSWALRAEYDQLNQFRKGIGSEQVGGLGFFDLPGVISKAGYVQATYLLTGETRPENGTPKVKHPFLGPEGGGATRGLGAWEVAFRYNYIQSKEPGASFLNNPFTPGFVPTFSEHTDEFTAGLNWYPNYWVKYQFNFNVDRLKQPSTIGAIPQNYFVLLNRLQFRF